MINTQQNAENFNHDERIADLEAQLRGDVDSLICKCGSSDCDETTAKFDVEDCCWTDEKRIEQLRAIVLNQHKKYAVLEAENIKLKEELESLRIDAERIVKSLWELCQQHLKALREEAVKVFLPSTPATIASLDKSISKMKTQWTTFSLRLRDNVMCKNDELIIDWDRMRELSKRLKKLEEVKIMKTTKRTNWNDPNLKRVRKLAAASIKAYKQYWDRYLAGVAKTLGYDTTEDAAHIRGRRDRRENPDSHIKR